LQLNGSPSGGLFFCQNEIVKLCTPLTVKGGFNFNDLKAFIAENRNGSGQVSSKKAYLKQPTIATRKKAQSPKMA